MESVTRRRAFTLIELMVVVAIISILSAIGMVNLQQAHVRSKVTRTLNDMRTIAVAVESYRVDERAYPPAAVGHQVLARPLNRLTSPVAYLTSIPQDLFSPAPLNFHDGIIMTGFNYKDRATTEIGLPGETYGPYWDDIPEAKYFIHSAGPNMVWDVVPYITYDPTNGTISAGDIARLGPM